MRWILSSIVFIFTTLSLELQAIDTTDNYLLYLKKNPKLISYLGDADRGEIEIILDKNKISEVKQKTGREVGIVAQDTYWIWINDAVKFPSGKYGVYGRILWQHALNREDGGVCVMPILPNGKIVLNRNFRHATRSWEYELPRGAVNRDESIENAALREVKEETGMIVENLKLLGRVAIDSGLTNSLLPIFSARITAQQKSEPEESEAIAGIESFSIEELKQGFRDGFLTSTIDGKSCQIPLRDPFLAFALFTVDFF